MQNYLGNLAISVESLVSRVGGRYTLPNSPLLHLDYGLQHVLYVDLPEWLHLVTNWVTMDCSGS